MKIICGWHVANSVLAKSFDEENYITFLKLNYLVYLICSEYLYLDGENLFNELFEKTENGPILPSIYFKFNCFDNSKITDFAKNNFGRAIGINSNLFDECLSHIWERYKNQDEDTILSYIENGNNYSQKENEEILTEIDMLLDEIDRKEKDLLNAKSYIKKLTPTRNITNK